MHAVYPSWIFFLGEGVEGGTLGLGKVHVRRATSKQWSSRLLGGRICGHENEAGDNEQKTKQNKPTDQINLYSDVEHYRPN